jgi:hypothetical protein
VRVARMLCSRIGQSVVPQPAQHQQHQQHLGVHRGRPLTRPGTGTPPVPGDPAGDDLQDGCGLVRRGTMGHGELPGKRTTRSGAGRGCGSPRSGRCSSSGSRTGRRPACWTDPHPGRSLDASRCPPAVQPEDDGNGRAPDHRTDRHGQVPAGDALPSSPWCRTTGGCPGSRRS